MAKRIREPEPEEYDAIAEEARPGESMEDFMERRDAEESEWKGKQGGRGAQKHDAHEQREPAAKFTQSETWDPHMGDN